jgi:aminopeptidase-like protein
MIDLPGENNVGQLMYNWAEELFPVCRSLTGAGVRQTLDYIRQQIPELTLREVKSGTRAFDWTVPEEWNIQAAWIEGPGGERIVDFNNNNLHVVGYSIPVDDTLSLEELQHHLHSLPEQPDAIPYVTSYYRSYWGFCLSHFQREALQPGDYRVVIDSRLSPGVLNYGELLIPGQSSREVFLSTYVCHPSMANNELSGPVVTTALARWILGQKSRRYSYRIIFIPETIGSIVYLSRNIEEMQKWMIAGFNVTCVGDDRCYSFLPSRDGDTVADRVALHVLKHVDAETKYYSWLDRGSDERQYCAPGVDMPVTSIMRSKYHEYPEYHTSLDNMSLISPKGLQGAFETLARAIWTLEHDMVPTVKVLCEPQLGRRGLYETLASRGSSLSSKVIMDLLTYADGKHSLLDIAELLAIPAWSLEPVCRELANHGLLECDGVQP